MQRSELLWTLSGIHTSLFFRLPCHRRVQQLFNPVNVLISKFFTGQTDWLTDGQILNSFPLRMHARGKKKRRKNVYLMPQCATPWLRHYGTGGEILLSLHQVLNKRYWFFLRSWFHYLAFIAIFIQSLQLSRTTNSRKLISFANACFSRVLQLHPTFVEDLIIWQPHPRALNTPPPCDGVQQNAVKHWAASRHKRNNKEAIG